MVLSSRNANWHLSFSISMWATPWTASFPRRSVSGPGGNGSWVAFYCSWYYGAVDAWRLVHKGDIIDELGTMSRTAVGMSRSLWTRWWSCPASRRRVIVFFCFFGMHRMWTCRYRRSGDDCRNGLFKKCLIPILCSYDAILHCNTLLESRFQITCYFQLKSPFLCLSFTNV
jgi:hypothetical protein